MQNRASKASLLVLATGVVSALASQACGGKSEDERRHRGDGSEAARAGEGGEPSGVGGGGGRGGGLSGMSGDAGAGGDAGDAGNAGTAGSAGEPPTGGNGGSGGAPVNCPTDGSECPDGCFELPLTTGCDDDLRRSHVCTSTRYDRTIIGCGVRESDGAIVYVDAPYDSSAGLNPFYEIEGFRACTQSEIYESDCRDFTDVPASRSVRFDVTNGTTEPLLLSVAAFGCAWLGIDRAPDWDELILDLNRPCGSACGWSADVEASADFVRLDPGESHSVEWDGRAAETADVIRACNNPIETASTWPEHHDDRCTGGRIAPVVPGRYRVALVALSPTLPFLARQCGSNETCSVELDVFGVASYQERCDEPTAFAEFDVPETGDVVVPVTLGN